MPKKAECGSCCGAPAADPFRSEQSSAPEKGEMRRFALPGLVCSTCAERIEQAVRQLPRVRSARLNFTAASLSLESDLPLAELLPSLQQIADRIEPGLMVSPWREQGPAVPLSVASHHWWRLGFGTLLLLLALLLAETELLAVPPLLPLACYLASYLLVGGSVLLAALRNLRRKLWFDENLLMTIATTGALVIGEYPEAVAVMLFYLVGEIFQGRAVDRSRRAIGKLLDIRPETANLLDGEQLHQVPPHQVPVGGLVLVRPGERVPLDGRIVAGESRVDSSALTGESVPRRMVPGDELLAGMVNGEGTLKVEVSREFSRSTLARILDLVEHAVENKAPTERFITRFARVYTPLVVCSALGIAVLPPLLAAGDWSAWCYRALIFLVISCPCALVISIPLGFFGGIGRASHQGILVKGGNHLETLARVGTVVFDKTGTLTRGVFEVGRIVPQPGFDEERLLELAAHAEAHSTHPIGLSIVQAYQRPLQSERIEVSRELPGLGVEASIDGQQVLAGNRRLLVQHGFALKPVTEPGSVVHLAVAGRYAGYLLVDDELRSDAKGAVERLRRLGVGRLVMLSGDREPVARRVAAELGLDDCHAELLPDGKLGKVEELLAAGRGKLVTVGDGINDAPILARSDVGVAMGGLGSDAAIEAADVVLMTDEPGKLVTAIETARLTERIVWQNIWLAFLTKGGVLLLGLFGLASLWQAIFADVGVALLAVMNAVRIVRD